MKIFLTLISVLLLSSCLTKSHFDTRTNSIENRIDNINFKSPNKFEEIDGKIYIGKGKIEYFSNSIEKSGIIRFYDTDSELTFNDAILYFATTNDDFNRGDIVYFNVQIQDQKAFAKNITTNSARFEPMEYKEEFISFNLHSNLWHAPVSEHRFGHIKPKAGAQVKPFENFQIIEGTIIFYRNEQTSELSQDSLNVWILGDRDYDYFPPNLPNPSNSLNRYTIGYLTDSKGDIREHLDKNIAVEFLITHSH